MYIPMPLFPHNLPSDTVLLGSTARMASSLYCVYQLHALLRGDLVQKDICVIQQSAYRTVPAVLFVEGEDDLVLASADTAPGTDNE